MLFYFNMCAMCMHVHYFIFTYNFISRNAGFGTYDSKWYIQLDWNMNRTLTNIFFLENVCYISPHSQYCKYTEMKIEMHKRAHTFRCSPREWLNEMHGTHAICVRLLYTNLHREMKLKIKHSNRYEEWKKWEEKKTICNTLSLQFHISQCHFSITDA